jgi:hypothetical protein
MGRFVYLVTEQGVTMHRYAIRDAREASWC